MPALCAYAGEDVMREASDSPDFVSAIPRWLSQGLTDKTVVGTVGRAGEKLLTCDRCSSRLLSYCMEILGIQNTNLTTRLKEPQFVLSHVQYSHIFPFFFLHKVCDSVGFLPRS